MELADVLDSKSSGSDTVSVRPRSPAPNRKTSKTLRFRGFSVFLFQSIKKFSTIFALPGIEANGTSDGMCDTKNSFPKSVTRVPPTEPTT